MGCFSREEKGYVEETAKWDFITLDDFHPRSSWTPLTYLWLWFLGIVGVAVFAADVFTAINLLAFDKWSSKVQPALPLKYSKWIYAGCILVSFALYAYEWQRAIRVIRRNGVAESYMDPLAVQIQSMRGKGWKRFLVFTELTKNRKGADYVALFVYFSFKGSIRILFAEAGRQVVNAITLWSVLQADFIPTGDHAGSKGQSPVVQFFVNVQALYKEDKEQAVVISTMIFTLVIWIFSALSLIAAVLCYITFLWHYIPQSDGRLSIYCRRKIDKRLEKIVEKKVKAALEEQERKRLKAEARAAKKGEKKGFADQPKRQPTLPQFGGVDNEKSSIGLTRQDTNTTLPPYSARPLARNDSAASTPTLARQPTLPDVDLPGARPTPSRSNTQASAYSNHSFSSNAPLIRNANEMGFTDSRSASPASAMLSQPITRQMSSSTFGSRPQPGRTLTSSSHGSARSYGPPKPPPPARSNTGFSFDGDRNPMSRAGSAMAGGYGPPRRQNTLETSTIIEQPTREGTPASGYTDSVYSQISQQRKLSRTSFNRPFSQDDRPALPLSRNPTISETIQALRSDSASPPQSSSSGNSGYVAFNPGAMRAPTAPPLSFASAPARQMTGPVQTQQIPSSFTPAPLQRSATAPLNNNGFI